MPRRKKESELGKGYVEEMREREKEQGKLMEKAGEEIEKSGREFEGARETEELREKYGKEYYEDLEKKGIKEEKAEELAPERLTTEKVNELLKQGLLAGENLSEISQLQDRVKSGEISREDFRKRIQEIVELNKEKKEELLKEREAKREIKEIDREKLENELSAELDEPLNDFIKSEGGIGNLDRKLKELEGKWFKGKERERLKENKGALVKEREEALVKMSEIEDEYIRKGLSASEIRQIIREKIDQRRRRGKEEFVGRAEVALEATKEAGERVKEIERELGRLDKEVDKEIKKQPKNKREAIKRLLKDPSFWGLVIGGAVAGASIVCPFFGVGYGALGVMGAKPATALWQIFGIAYGATAVSSFTDLLKQRKERKKIRIKEGER